MAHTFNEDWRETISAQILAAKSFYDPENSATSQKLLSGAMTLSSLSETKLGLQLSLAHSSLHSQTSNTSQESGNEIVKKNDYLELVSQVLWTTR
jgi:hypothetical protein